MALKDYSTTAASNTSAPPNGWPEGMTIANVNNNGREMMAVMRNFAAEDTIASATTCDLGTKDATFLTISGTTTITGFGTVSAGIYKFVKFSGALTLTHNATSLILLTGANRTTVAGDCGLYKSEGSGNWREYFYARVGDYQPLDSTLTAIAGDTLGAFGHRNKIINGNFAVNQRAVSGTVVLAAGAYGHDRWKAGSGGCTYTFATSANVTTLTISAGTLQQVIEGENLLSGTHVLTWTGTATARVDSGSYSTSGMTGTAVGGTNQTIEFATGTVSKVQYETGSVATPFEHRMIGTERNLCARYYQLGLREAVGFAVNTTSIAVSLPLPITMRAAPTVTLLSTSPYSESTWFGVVVTPAGTASINSSHLSASSIGVIVTGYSGLTANAVSMIDGTNFALSAEL